MSDISIRISLLEFCEGFRGKRFAQGRRQNLPDEGAWYARQGGGGSNSYYVLEVSTSPGLSQSPSYVKFSFIKLGQGLIFIWRLESGLD